MRRWRSHNQGNIYKRLAWNVLVPCLVLTVLAAPAIPYMLPACQDYMDEIYQPLQALKFFKTHGHAFHKYGPMPNFILAPGYGVCLAYWKVTGTLGKPSDDFPYGLKDPFFQMTVLIAQTRVIFLILGIVSYAYLAHTLRLITRNRAAAGLAMLFCIATNFPLIHSLPTARPDSPMLAFSAAALAVYIRIIYRGLTLRRAIACTVLVVFATSSKELAATMFVLPLAALALATSTHDTITTSQRIKILIQAALAGAVVYALINIVYAPATWLERMKFWLVGPGIDPNIWASGKGKIFNAALKCMADNLGPAGSVIVHIALAAAFKSPRRKLLMLALPLISVSFLGVGRIMYPADRFYTIIALALVPLVTIGLGALLDQRVHAQLRAATHAALFAGFLVNFWFATFAWHMLGGEFHHIAERDIVTHLDKYSTVCLLNTFPVNVGSSRLEKLGYKQDCRPIQEIAAERRHLPDRIYTPLGDLLFLQQARQLPARAKMIKNESGFDILRWPGLEPLGYRLAERIVPSTPTWFALNWMPAVEEWRRLHTVLVFERDDASRPQLANMAP